MNNVLYFLKLLFFKSSPADAPYSKNLLWVLAAMQVAVTAFVIVRLQSSMLSLLLTYLILLMVAAWWTKFVLKKAGKSERFNQVAIALLGTHVLVGVLCVYPQSEQLILMKNFMQANQPSAAELELLTPEQRQALNVKLHYGAAEYIQANFNTFMTIWSFVTTILTCLWVGVATRIMSLALDNEWWKNIMYISVVLLLELIFLFMLALASGVMGSV